MPNASACVGRRQQGPQRGRQHVGPARGHEQARHLVHDGVLDAADRAGDHRAPAGHGLQRHDPERLVPGHAHHRVRRAQQRRHVRPGDRAEQPDAVRDARRGRRLPQPPRVRVAVQRGACSPEPAGPPATSSSTPGSRRSAAITSSTPLRRTRRPSTTIRGRSERGCTGPSGEKAAVSTPHGTTVVAPARGAQAGELEHLVGAGGDDPVDAPGDGALGGDPAGRAGVVGALVAALDAAQGVEGLHDRAGPAAPPRTPRPCPTSRSARARRPGAAPPSRPRGRGRTRAGRARARPWAPAPADPRSPCAP